MSKDKKISKAVHCEIDKEIADDLERLCKNTGLSKTVAIERALKAYIECYIKTGRS